jgi:hypothetical protein
MPHIIAKNTFIAFVDENDEVASSPKSWQGSLRAKSAEIVRNRPFAELLDEHTQPSLQRLNAVLSVGISPLQAASMEAQSTSIDLVESSTMVAPGGKAGFSELRSLQEMLGKALAESIPPTGSSPLQKPLSGMKESIRNASNSSISTMAPEDASECGTPARGGLRGMRHAWSSNSVSTMVSEFDESIAEEESNMEFELNVQEKQDHTAVLAESVPTSSSVSRRGRGHSSREEFCHGLVPRTQNLEELYNKTGKDAPPTTMMIRNIPSRYTQQELVLDLKDLGLTGTFDFLYIPVDKGTSANVGYAFVNFIDATWAAKSWSPSRTITSRDTSVVLRRLHVCPWRTSKAWTRTCSITRTQRSMHPSRRCEGL